MGTKKNETIVKVILTVITLILGLCCIYPFIFMISSSFKPSGDVLSTPLQIIPKNFTLTNFETLFHNEFYDFFKWFGNTVVMTGLTLILKFFIITITAYGFAKIKFPGRDAIFLVLLAGLMIPSDIMIMPRYIIFKQLHILNTMWALILPAAVDVYFVFLLRQAFVAVPDALSEAARIDGCSHFTIYRRIILPLCMPQVSTMLLFSFVWSWNDYMGLLWGANGLFQAMIWPPIVHLFAESMPLERQKRACVSINSTTPAGTLAAYALSAVLLQFADWHHVFFSCGGLLLGMAAVFWLGTAPLRRATTYAPQPEFQKQKGTGNLPAALLAAGLGTMLLPVLLHGGLKDGVTNWVPSMIQSNFGISPAFSAAAAMALSLVNLSGAYLSGWLNEHCAHNELKTAGFLFALASVCLLALPLAMRTSLLLAVLLLAVTTASMLVVNTMFINVIPVKAGRHGGASMLSGTLNAVTYLGAAAATWGIGAAAEGFGWNAVFLLWLVMAMLALLVSALLAGRWGEYLKSSEGGVS